jgi:hypothetical protein
LGIAIYVFGGNDMNMIPQNSVFKYDTVADAWSTLAPMRTYCVNHSVSVLDDLVYIVGAGHLGREFLRFDPVSGAWHSLAPTTSHRKYGVTFVLGGCLYAAGRGNAAIVERYDVTSDTWTIVASMLEIHLCFGPVTIGSTGLAEEQDLFDLLIVKATTPLPLS